MFLECGVAATKLNKGFGTECITTLNGLPALTYRGFPAGA